MNINKAIKSLFNEENVLHILGLLTFLIIMWC
jgi:hypothetical protein